MTTAAPTQTLDQRRAAHALKRINTHVAAKNYGNYKSYAEALPATIVMNGLGQACAALLAKAKGDRRSADRLLYDDLQSWLCHTDDTIAAPYAGQSDLIDAITAGDQRTYVRAQAEALAYLTWLKKFAQAFLDQGDGKED